MNPSNLRKGKPVVSLWLAKRQFNLGDRLHRDLGGDKREREREREREMERERGRETCVDERGGRGGVSVRKGDTWIGNPGLSSPLSSPTCKGCWLSPPGSCFSLLSSLVRKVEGS